jgi:hypothetical protein
MNNPVQKKTLSGHQKTIELVRGGNGCKENVRVI